MEINPNNDFIITTYDHRGLHYLQHQHTKHWPSRNINNEIQEMQQDETKEGMWCSTDDIKIDILIAIYVDVLNCYLYSFYVLWFVWLLPMHFVLIFICFYNVKHVNYSSFLWIKLLNNINCEIALLLALFT